VYKVDTDAIALKVKQEFAARDRKQTMKDAAKALLKNYEESESGLSVQRIISQSLLSSRFFLPVFPPSNVPALGAPGDAFAHPAGLKRTPAFTKLDRRFV
jgi:hypothetical protein